MKKAMKTAVRFILPLLILTMLFSLNAAAASKVVKMKKSGTTFSLSVKGTKYTNIYARFSVPAPCYIAVTGNKVGMGDTRYGIGIDLLNSKKKKLEYAFVDAQKEDLEGTAIWALNKGTYYLKASNSMPFAIAASYKKITAKSGTSKYNAVTLTRNKAIRNILASGEKASTADWYKFYMPSKVLGLEFTSLGSAPVAYQIYGPSYASGIYAGYTSKSQPSRKIFSTSKGVKAPVKPGWYYLKVYRLTTSSNTSGVYSIKWKY